MVLGDATNRRPAPAGAPAAPDHLAKPKMGLTPKFGANIVKKDHSSVSNVDNDYGDNDDDNVDGL